MELLIKIDKDSSIESIAKAIKKIKGVESVTKIADKINSVESKPLSEKLQKLMGCVPYTVEEIEADPKLSYLFNK